MSKKVSYMNLLKEAISDVSEYDTSDNLEVKGPMLDPIISWDGGGEIPTYKDAASILERYYFNEENDEGVTVSDDEELQSDYQNDKGDSAGPSMQNAKGAGTEQAGTSDSDTILGGKEEKEEDIAKEGFEYDLDEWDLLEAEWDDENVPKAKVYGDEEGGDEDKEDEDEEDEDEDNEKETSESYDLDMENAIIEKLIQEMEDEDSSDIMTYTDDDVASGMSAPDEEKADGPEDDAQGAGTQQAGTGPDEGEIPDRDDIHDQMVEPKVYRGENNGVGEAFSQSAIDDIELGVLEELEYMLEQDEGDEGTPEEEADAAEEGGEEAKDLDVDQDMKEWLELDEAAPPPAAVPGGPSPKKTDEDYEDDEGAYSEAMRLFREDIEEDVEDIDSDDIRV